MTLVTLHLQLIIAPNKDYDDLNNCSVSIKLTCGKNSFVFTGDAESAEKDICANGINLTADVFHAGHHGSSTSNGQEILDAIKPAYIVISYGKDNSHGHPHKETLDRIKDLHITSFQTDVDGTNILWSTKNDTITETVTPTPTVTLEPTATFTPEPTETPTPSPEPTATPTPSPAPVVLDVNI